MLDFSLKRTTNRRVLDSSVISLITASKFSRPQHEGTQIRPLPSINDLGLTTSPWYSYHEEQADQAHENRQRKDDPMFGKLSMHAEIHIEQANHPYRQVLHVVDRDCWKDSLAVHTSILVVKLYLSSIHQCHRGTFSRPRTT